MNKDKVFVHPFAKKVYPEWEDLLDQALEKHREKNYPIDPNPSFSKSSLISMRPDMFSWMGGVSMRMVVPVGSKIPDWIDESEVVVTDDLLQFVKDWVDKCAVKFPYSDRKMIALDLETTGLSNNWRLVNGQVDTDVNIIGVPLAVTPDDGVYIPVGHTEQDGILNWSKNDLLSVFDYIQKNLHTIYHNAQYDMAVLMNYGVVVNSEDLTDTMLVNKLMNNWEFFPIHVKNGLKQLSKYVLGRGMIEIGELMDTGSKKADVILFNRLPTVNAYAYGVSDACNTMGLMNAFVLEDKYDRNPYKHQKLVTNIFHRVVYHSIASLGLGMPVDFDRLMSTITTINIRINRLQSVLDKYTTKYGFDQVSMSSPVIGNFIVHVMKSYYKGDDDSFYEYLSSHFGMGRKVTQLKDRVKEEFSTKDEIISKMSDNMDTVDFLPDDVKSDMSDLIESLSLFRTLNKDRASYLGVLNSCFLDDRNTVFTPIGLTISGTDTGRYSSQKGSGRFAYLSMHRLKTKTKGVFENGNGLTAALNSQGMPSDGVVLKKMKKLTKVPKRVGDIHQSLVNDAEYTMCNQLAEMAVKKR